MENLISKKHFQSKILNLKMKTRDLKEPQGTNTK
jgi:hypothetical protein